MNSRVLVSSFEGNTQKLDGGAMFGNAPKPLWSRWISPDEFGRIQLSCRSFLVETDQKKILLETGIGAFFEPGLAKRYGIQTPETHVLLKNLKKANIEPKDIDFVILSHLHFDHAGGLLKTFRAESPLELAFPNAQFIVGQVAWERALEPHPRDRASFIPELQSLLQTSGRLVIVSESSHPSLPGCFSFSFTEGHTPGQMHTWVQGLEARAIFAGDLVPGSHWVHLPISMGYDRFPERVIDEKGELYSQLNPEDLLLFTHDSLFSAARLKKNEKARWQTGKSFESLVQFPL